MEKIGKRISELDLNENLLKYMLVRLLTFMSDEELEEVDKWLDNLATELEEFNKLHLGGK